MNTKDKILLECLNSINKIIKIYEIDKYPSTKNRTVGNQIYYQYQILD
jgi:hypothetical protein